MFSAKAPLAVAAHITKFFRLSETMAKKLPQLMVFFDNNADNQTGIYGVLSS
ncbi:MAG: hypothetical protein INF55_11135 [Roseomonas sp.]|nr:hypothetical protein [Roseomonas sp.]MCA3335318.1 hypothetical protein [Roseomonas sp.]MCA3373192.1 hypothetical protein [Roseomonas sp.]MCA3398310.1 hypothetical protein [Roseomonas sp.]